MRPCFIYFNEIKLDDNNAFTLDFSNEELKQEVSFSTKNDYFIASLNCNLIVKEHIDKKKKLIEDLSKKSRLLLEKDPTYQNDIDQIEYCINSRGLITYKNFFKFSLPTEIINLLCWKYEYYDLIEKKLGLVKFIRHICILLLQDLLLNRIMIILITLGLMIQIV